MKHIYNALLCTVLFSSSLLGQHEVPTDTLTQPLRSELTIGIVIGAGANLIRSTLSPSIEAGINCTQGSKYMYEMKVSSSFFFEKNSAEKFNTYANTFLIAEWYWNSKSPTRKLKKDINGWQSIGLGFLINAQGDYFFGTTCKASYNIMLSKHIKASAELYFTDDFHSIFPGIGIQVN